MEGKLGLMNKYLEMLDQENDQLLGMRDLLIEEFNIEEELLVEFLQDSAE